MKKIFTIFFILALILSSSFTQEAKENIKSSNLIQIDFRNQEISDVIYAISDMCGKSVFIDETVKGKVSFKFEDADYDKAVNRFCDYAQIFVEKKDNIYYFSKIKIEQNKSRLSVQCENVNVEQFLVQLSRKTQTTILYDQLPTINITVRTTDSTIVDVLNLITIKLNGFTVERIGTGYYLCKSSTSTAKRNMDSYKLTLVDSEKQIYDLNLQKAQSLNVIDDLFKKGEKEYSFINVKSITIENMFYSNKTFDELLKLLLEQSNCDYSIDNNIYYIFEVQKKDLIKGHKKTQIIHLENYSVETIVNLIPSDFNASSFLKIDRENNSIYITGSTEEITPIINFIKQIDVPLEGRYYKKFTLINANVKEIVPIIPKKLLYSDIIVVPNSNSFITQVTPEREKQLADYLQVVDQKGNAYPVTLKYIKSSDLIQNLPPSVSKELIILTQNDSFIFLNTTEEVYKQFLKELEYIDKPNKQIKYQILVLQKEKNSGLNISGSTSEKYTSEAPSMDHSVNLSNIANITFDIVSEFGINFAVSLNAQISEEKSHILADTTLNGISGKAVSFSNTSTARYTFNDAKDISTGISSATIKEISSGLNISITGWVSGDGMVTVDVSAEISNEKQSASTNSSGMPNTSSKKITTNVRTKSGEPLVIGGLLQQEQRDSDSRVPFLGKIPILGYLFKSKDNSNMESEFVIYLIPFVEDTESSLEKKNSRIKRLYDTYIAEQI